MTESTKKNKIVRPGSKTDRVGLFGGTFNPVHLGHVKIAGDVKEEFRLDRIIVIPSAIPPHKNPDSIVSASDRLEMVRKSFCDLDGFEVSDIELRRKGPSYTVDTVLEILSSMTEKSSLFLLLGTDAFFEIHTWHRHDDLLRSVPLIIMTRPGDKMEGDLQKKERAGSYIQDKISKNYLWDYKNRCFHHSSKKRLYFSDVTPLDISSTRIRKSLKDNNCSSPSFLNDDVEAYIFKKGLYK